MSITRTQDQITPSLTEMAKGINKFPAKALVKVKQLTPVKTGNARSHTVLQNNKTITGNYTYAGALNDGKSRQAPQGIVTPFIPWADAEVLKIITGGNR